MPIVCSSQKILRLKFEYCRVLDYYKCNLCSNDPTQVIDLPGVILQVPVQVKQKAASAHRLAQNVFRIRRFHLRLRKRRNQIGDGSFELLHSRKDLGKRQPFGGELQRPVALVGNLTKLANDVLAQVAFQVQRKIAR